MNKIKELVENNEINKAYEEFLKSTYSINDLKENNLGILEAFYYNQHSEPKKAFEILKKSNDKKTLIPLGNMYEFYKKDLKKALSLYEEAYDFDLNAGIDILRLVLTNKIKYDINPIKENLIFQKNKRIFNFLGEYEYSINGEKEKIKNYFEEGIKYQDAHAAINLGNCYNSNFFEKKDVLKAIECYKIAFDLEKIGLDLLVKTMENNNMQSDVLKLLEFEKKENNLFAIILLARRYLDHPLYIKNQRKAFSCLKILKNIDEFKEDYLKSRRKLYIQIASLCLSIFLLFVVISYM